MRVCIVGGGIVGACCAAFLQAAGAEVILFDPLIAGQSCSYGNAGSIAPGSVVPLSTPSILRQVPAMLTDPHGAFRIDWLYAVQAIPWLIRFVCAGRESRVFEIAAALSALHANAFEHYAEIVSPEVFAQLIARTGQLFVYDDEQAYQKDSLGWALRRTHQVQFEQLSPRQLQELLPALNPDIRHGIYLPQFGFCRDPHALVMALIERLKAARGRVVQGNVDRLELRGDRVVAVHSGRQRYVTDELVVAAGAWTAPFMLKHLHTRLPIESLRGYHVAYDVGAVDLRLPVYPIGGKFIATPMRSQIRAAGTVEVAGLHRPTDPARSAALKNAAERYFPGLRGRAESVWMGHRPATPDSLPIIGPAPHQSNVFLAVGHGQTGLIGAATTGRLLRDVICQRPPVIDPNPYRASRFSIG